MIRTALGVVGANFGDEGKGLATDHLASMSSGTVVARTNGGAQAGHTVVTEDGRRHVFSHFGAGALSGAGTYLGRRFISNPILFLKERERLASAGGNLEVAADPRGSVTTPWDMLCNQIAEEMRGTARHGSCGMGIGETVGRCLDPSFSTTVSDLADIPALLPKLERIRRDWLPARLEALGFPGEYGRRSALLMSDSLMENWLDDVASFMEAVRVRMPGHLRSAGSLVIEGAQGLLLDEGHRWFPHVTRSRTGIANMVELCADAGIGSLDVTYVTRCYLTRHGAGPFPGETASAPVDGFSDMTNVPNPWQGTLRFAPLDIRLLAETVAEDLGRASGSGVEVRHGIMTTCIDQAAGKHVLHSGADGHAAWSEAEGIAEAAATATSASWSMVSRGPSRNAITPSSCHRAGSPDRTPSGASATHA
jgi:adenylosuccinate synthase